VRFFSIAWTKCWGRG